MDMFRLRLEQLKAQGVDIDPQKITEEVIESLQPKNIKDLTAEEIEEKAYNLTLKKVIELINDYRDHYKPKGRTLKVIVRVEKDNSADAFGEKFVFDEGMEVINMIEIGTKGKYQKAIEEG
jgi:hypothetical protein